MYSVLVIRKYVISKPFKQGANKGYVIGFEDGVRYGIEKARDIGRRKDDSRNIELLLRKPQIKKMISRYGKLEEEYTKEACFHGITKEYMIYMYTGLSNDINKHVDEIEKRISICESEDKHLLVIMALTNVNIDIASQRLHQYKELNDRYASNDRVCFDKYVEYGKQEDSIFISEDEIVQAAIDKLDDDKIKRELYIQDDL